MKIEKLQKRACKVILNYEYDDILQSMNNMHIMTVHERIFIRKAKFMYKVYNNSFPSHVTDLFNRRNLEDESVPVLRSTTLNNFLLPKPRTELYRNSLAFTGPLVWNCLPQNVKSSSSINGFHNSCIKWMKAVDN